MRPSHLPGIMVIERASFAGPWSEAAFIGEMTNPGGACFAALEGRRVAGYVCFLIVAEEAHLQKVAVAEGRRRRGIARGLVKRCIEESRLRGAKRVLLEVRASNAAAVSFYRSLGFGVDGVRKRYYASPVEDAVLMSLGLEGLTGAEARSPLKA